MRKIIKRIFPSAGKIYYCAIKIRSAMTHNARVVYCEKLVLPKALRLGKD